MPSITESLKHLDSCHPDLQILFKEVIKYFPCKTTCGFRNQQEQDAAFASGKTQLKWPNGNHNKYPSTAVDVYPTPIDFNDIKRFYLFAGVVLGIAKMLKVQGKMQHNIRWGGDWDGDTEIKDNNFNDLVHFELV